MARSAGTSRSEANGNCCAIVGHCHCCRLFIRLPLLFRVAAVLLLGAVPVRRDTARTQPNVDGRHWGWWIFWWCNIAGTTLRTKAAPSIFGKPCVAVSTGFVGTRRAAPG